MSSRQFVLLAVLYRFDLLYREIEQCVKLASEMIRKWARRHVHYFEPNCLDGQGAAVDETNIEIEGKNVYT